MKDYLIHHQRLAKSLLVANVLMAIIYFSWWFFPSHVGNPYLYSLLFLGEVYHIFMAFTFWFTIWPRKEREHALLTDTDSTTDFSPSVDIFIPVAGEPIEVIRATAEAAKDIRYTNKTIHILNDGFVAGSDNWQDVEALAKQLNINCFTRQTPGGAKAGNINNALRQTSGEIVVIFDADMIAFPEFMEKMIPYFKDKKVGFVQSPQYYQNFLKNEVTGGAWEQQQLFFGPIMKGKDSNNAAFICGTNVAIRREAIMEVGGMNGTSIAEDFLTSLFIHQKGWKSHYTTEVLSRGLAPEDLLSYFKQQLRWARGNLQVLFEKNPLLQKGLSFSQRIEYLASSLYYFNGVVVTIDMMMPLIFLFFGIQPVSASTTSFALFFIPFMVLNLTTLYQVSGKTITFRAISFSQASWTLQLMALFSIITRQKMSFAVTPKQAQEGNFLFLVYPHIIYIILGVIASGVGIVREGVTPAIITNVAWVIFNAILFIPFIMASFNWKKISKYTSPMSPAV